MRSYDDAYKAYTLSLHACDLDSVEGLKLLTTGRDSFSPRAALFESAPVPLGKMADWAAPMQHPRSPAWHRQLRKTCARAWRHHPCSRDLNEIFGGFCRIFAESAPEVRPAPRMAAPTVPPVGPVGSYTTAFPRACVDPYQGTSPVTHLKARRSNMVRYLQLPMLRRSFRRPVSPPGPERAPAKGGRR